jgi:hypothetical protein
MIALVKIHFVLFFGFNREVRGLRGSFEASPGRFHGNLGRDVGLPHEFRIDGHLKVIEEIRETAHTLSNRRPF